VGGDDWLVAARGQPARDRERGIQIPQRAEGGEEDPHGEAGD
jgi:hypothetical protein